MVRVGVGTRAVARAKVPPVPVRKLRAAIPRQRQAQTLSVFLIGLAKVSLMSNSELLRPQPAGDMPDSSCPPRSGTWRKSARRSDS